ncbi:hypothetical protein ACG7TL_008689 [Trametes sanguinea]
MQDSRTFPNKASLPNGIRLPEHPPLPSFPQDFRFQGEINYVRRTPAQQRHSEATAREGYPGRSSSDTGKMRLGGTPTNLCLRALRRVWAITVHSLRLDRIPTTLHHFVRLKSMIPRVHTTATAEATEADEAIADADLIVGKREPPGTLADCYEPVHTAGNHAASGGSQLNGLPLNHPRRPAAESTDINHFMQKEPLKVAPASVKFTPPTAENFTTTAEPGSAQDGVPLPVATDATPSAGAPQSDMPSSTLGPEEGHDACSPSTSADVPSSPDGRNPDDPNASTISLPDRASSRTTTKQTYGHPSSIATSPEPDAILQQLNGDVELPDMEDRQQAVQLRLLAARVEELAAKLDIVRFEMEMLRMGMGE